MQQPQHLKVMPVNNFGILKADSISKCYPVVLIFWMWFFKIPEIQNS